MLYVVMNKARNEGYVTDDEDDAKWVAGIGPAGSFCGHMSVPTVGKTFRDSHEEDLPLAVERIVFVGDAKG